MPHEALHAALRLLVEQHMKVVAHQAVGKQLHIIAELLVGNTGAITTGDRGQISCQQLQKKAKIIRIKKDRLLAGTSGKYVVVTGGNVNFEDVATRHSFTISDNNNRDNKERPLF